MSNQVCHIVMSTTCDYTEVFVGEAVIITRAGVSRRQVSEPAIFAPDIFEYVYFARPDSVLDGISVYRSRMAMGDALADEVQKILNEHNLTVDVVIPVRQNSVISSFWTQSPLGTRHIQGCSIKSSSEVATAIP